MITAMTRAVQTMLEQTGLTVWRRGCVPEEAVLPYLVWTMTLSEDGSLTVDVVTRKGRDDDLALMAAVESLFPAGGRLLQTSEGWAALWPGKITWMEDEHGIRIGRMMCRMKGMRI